MSELPKTKPELSKLRVELIEQVAKATVVKERMQLQLRLSEVNAEIKRLNKIASAEDQHNAAIRKTLGRKEAEANEVRHEERIATAATLPDYVEQTLVRAKQLHREMTRYPRPHPAHFAPMMAALTDFIDAQKAVVKGESVVLQPESEWQETWKTDK
jgi:hypothetical protein